MLPLAIISKNIDPNSVISYNGEGEYGLWDYTERGPTGGGQSDWEYDGSGVGGEYYGEGSEYGNGFENLGFELLTYQGNLGEELGQGRGSTWEMDSVRWKEEKLKCFL